MTLIDANLLLYATISDFPQHAAARGWLEGLLNGAARVGMPWESLTAFVRIATNRRVFPSPMAPEDAWTHVDTWLARPQVWIPQATEAHATLLGRLVRGGRISAGLVPDAHLAALAISHGLELCSADTDFRLFPGLRFRNPLTG